MSCKTAATVVVHLATVATVVVHLATTVIVQLAAAGAVVVHLATVALLGTASERPVLVLPPRHRCHLLLMAPLHAVGATQAADRYLR